MWRNNVSGFPYAMRVWRKLKPADVTSFHAPFSFVLQYKNGIGVCTHTIHRSPKWIIRLYRKMDRIYAGSHATVAEASVIASGITDRLRAIHNCVEVSDSLPPYRDASDRRLRLIYVGRFAPDKGLCSLIGGSIDALRMGHKICVTTVGPQTNDEGGDSAFYHAMRQMVAQNCATEYFNFMPNIKDRVRLFGLIDEHDVFCLPSISGETFSIAALEAMSRAKPLLTSNYGPVTEMVADGISGLVLEAGNRGAWARGIGRVAGERGKLREMGRASWLKARKEFSVDVIAEQYISDFKELIERKRTR
jgi:glycosyltransferase involved in cell wall biosynthesis